MLAAIVFLLSTIFMPVIWLLLLIGGIIALISLCIPSSASQQVEGNSSSSISMSEQSEDIDREDEENSISEKADSIHLESVEVKLPKEKPNSSFDLVTDREFKLPQLVRNNSI
jgi:hypothetical protein